MDEINSVRKNLVTFGSNRVNAMLGFGGGYNSASEDEIKLMRQSRYGIGTKRTLEQAEAFTGINFKSRKMDVNRCGNLLWVPFEESSNYGVEEVLSRGHAGEKVRPYVLTSDISHSVRQVELAERSLKKGKINPRAAITAPMDYKLLGGLLLLVLAFVLKAFAGGKVKDENYKK